ncbi:MAG: thiopurine S-methyltransferase [Gallionella sp.]|nr:thiopurine S-methyltransferase [Gallionella sp.]MDD4959262.1 thiopurine S-methyltransferase [Gallionella sp.]
MLNVPFEIPSIFATNGDNPLWLQCWHDQHTDDFHQSAVNPLLCRFWPTLKLAQQSRVFVPLCGKSLDMIWLVQQGHEVIGVELSPIAVHDFFSENKLLPVQQQQGKFTLWRYGKISILCGDYFALTTAEVGLFDTVYDRAALTALPESIRSLYVAQLRRLLPASTQVLLLTIEDTSDNTTFNQAIAVDEEIKALYSDGFEIDLAYVESVVESDMRAEYKVYRLKQRTIK